MIHLSPIGEIIETSTLGFVAQALALHAAPELGALTRVALGGGPEAMVVYAVVTYSETGGIDSGRRAVRRGSDAVHDEAIYREHPELVHVLRTVFRARIVGFAAGGGSRHYLPPTPPPLHYSVWACAPEEARAFSADLLYLRMLVAEDEPVSVEQLLAAHIRVIHRLRGEDDAWLRAAGRAVARLFRDDYDRLLTVLRSVDPGAPVPILEAR